MKKIILMLALLVLAGCGEIVTVPPAFEGKVLTPNGYKPDNYPPSTFRLSACWRPGAICDELVLIEKSDKGMKEEFTLFMPKNELTMAFDFRMTASIRDGKTDAILNRVAADEISDGGLFDNGQKIITFDKVYRTYAQPIIRDAVRSVVAKYTIDEVASSRDAVNAAIIERLEQVLSNTPIRLLQGGIAHAAYPDIITKRKEQAEERRIEIEQEEARKQVRLVQLQTDLEAAKAERAILREKAEAAAEQNKIFADSITPEYVEYRKLEVMSELARSGSTVFIPFDALGNVGLSQKIFTGQK